MSTITLRSTKGSALTNAEVDANFTNLNTDKLELGGTYTSGNTNAIHYFNNSKVFSSNSTFVFDGANLGVGIAAPAANARIHAYGQPCIRIESSTTTDGYVHFVNTSGSMSFGMSGAAANVALLYDRTNSHTAYQYAGGASGYHLWATANVERMRLDASGNLGVGVTAMSQKFVVAGANTNSSFTINNVSGTMTVMDTTTPSAVGVGGKIVFGSTYYTYGNSIGAAEIGSYKENAPDNGSGEYSHALVFKTSHYTSGIAERMRIDSSGNVGVGGSPTTKLHVYAASNTGILVSSTDGTTVKGALYNTNNNAVGIGAISANTPVAIFTSNTERVRIDASGKVGIGNSAPAYTLDVTGIISASAGTNFGAYKKRATGLSVGGNNLPGYALIGRYRPGTSWASGAGLFIDVVKNYYNQSPNKTTYSLGRDAVLRLVEASGYVTNSLYLKGPVTYAGLTDVYEIWATYTIYSNYAYSFRGYWDSDTIISGQYEGLEVVASASMAPTTTDPTGLVAATVTGIVNLSTGNIGLGASAPATKVQINSAAPTLRLQETTTGGDKRIEMGVTSAGLAWIGANQSAQDLTFQTVNSERMRISSTGTITTAGIVGINGGTPGTDYALNLNASTGVTGGLLAWNSGTTISTTLYSAASVGVIGVREAYPLITHVNGAERMRVDSTGKVGIGTSSPSAILEVRNATGAVSGLYEVARLSTSFSTYTALNRGGVLTFADAPNGYAITGGIAGIREGSSGNYNGALAFYTSNPGGVGPVSAVTDSAFYERMRIDSAGNVGIGTASPSTKLEVYGQRIRVNSTSSDPGIEIANGTAVKGYVFFDTANDRVTIRHASNSGINTNASGQVTTPAQPYYLGYASPSTGYSNTWQVLNYSGSQANVGNCYNTSNGRFTAPIAGVYSICAYALVSAGSSTGADYRLAIRKNGNEALITSATKPVGYATVSACLDWYLGANDYVEVCFYNDNGTGALHPDVSFTRLSIRLAG